MLLAAPDDRSREFDSMIVSKSITKVLKTNAMARTTQTGDPGAGGTTMQIDAAFKLLCPNLPEYLNSGFQLLQTPEVLAAD